MGVGIYRDHHRVSLTIAIAAMTTILTACSPSGAGTETTTVTNSPADTLTTLPPPTDVPATTTTVPAVVIPTIDESTIVVEPGDDVAAIVDAAPAGSHFVFMPGLYRTEEAHPKDGMVFEGYPGTILSGAIPLDGFEASGDTWQLSGIDLSDFRHGECVTGYDSCNYRNDLYMDDRMLWRVDSRDELVPSTWWSDGSTIVVADDPNPRRVELSVTEHAFIGVADDVTIHGLIVEKYASIAQDGAIQAQEAGQGALGSGWLIENVEARLNHASGVRTGDRTTVRNLHSHHNGQEGLTGDSGSDILIEDSEINNNNIRGFDWGWEAGGVKFTRTDGLVIRNVSAHNNRGPGLWTDINCSDTTYEQNVVHDNTGPGIFHEISHTAVIRGNEVRGNGFSFSVWLWGAGILIAASNDVEVVDNVVTGNADGIAGIQQERIDDDGRPWLLSDLWVHDNTVSMASGQTGVVEDVGDSSVFTDRNLVFDSNTYLEAPGKAFAWNGQNLNWQQWVAAGQDANGTFASG